MLKRKEKIREPSSELNSYEEEKAEFSRDLGGTKNLGFFGICKIF